MKIYKVTHNDQNIGTVLSWHSNKADAEKLVRELNHSMEFSSPYVNIVEFPTDKAGIIKWLNAYFNTDNG